MKLNKTPYLLLFFALAVECLSAQTATGSWYGKAEANVSGVHDNYLTELVIKQKGTRVAGIFGYYFRDKYQSIFVHGRYNPQTHEVTILNIPVIYYGSNSTINSIDCNTNFRGTLINSKFKSELKGFFYHDERYAHMCPDLMVDYTLDRNEKEDSVLNNATVGAQIWKPQADDIVVDASKKTDSAKMKLDSVVREAIARVDLGKEIQDSAEAPSAPPAPDPDKLDKQDDQKISASFAKRTPVLNTILDVESDSVRVSFYDNGIIDGDSISVFLNHELILKHQELEAKALTLYLVLDSARDFNELSMFAENLGKYPPNTALMVVTDGKNRYEVFMSSSLQENATIKLRVRRPGDLAK